MTTVNEGAIREFISTRLLDGRAVSQDEDLLLSGLLDSLGVMSLVAHIEKMVGGQIPAQDITIENFTSVETIARYVNAR